MLPSESGREEKGEDVGASRLDGPSWSLIHDLAETSALSREGKAAIAHLLDRLEVRLGRAWPRRLHAQMGGLPPELLSFSTHVWVLPQFLTFVVQLEAVVEEPTFSPVLRVLKQEPSVSNWRHVRLQLEVARAARAASWGAEFEPSIPGSAKKGDLLLEAGGDRKVLVETTTLFRGALDLLAQSFEDELRERISAIERLHSVHATTELSEQLDRRAAEVWLKAIDTAAEQVSASGIAQEVGGPGGLVRLQVADLAPGTTSFTGMSRERDAIPRLGGALADKARQTTGPYLAWVRIDARDGLFGFTDWSRMSSSERAMMLAEATRPYTDGHEHLDGIVYSSGAVRALGATDPAIANASVETDAGYMVRRLLAPHLARETVIVPLNPSGADMAGSWARAYEGEPAWLDSDLIAVGLPPLAAFWN